MDFGNIALTNSKKGFIPKLIKWFIGCKFNHSLVTIPPCLGRPMGIESSPAGVAVVAFDKTYIDNPNRGYEIWEFKVSEDDKVKGIRAVIDELQTAYGYLEYPWLVWRRINKWFGRDIKGQNNWIGQGTICSEMVVMFITNAGHGHLFDQFGIGSVTPGDIRDVMLANPTYFQLKEVKE